MSGCCYLGTLWDAESLAESQRLPIADVLNAINVFYRVTNHPNFTVPSELR